MKSNRVIEVDILRVIAILGIVAGHIQFHVPGFENSNIVGMIELPISVCGLSLFFFLSGYSLMIKKPEFNRFNDWKSYSIKRMTRIYPLYWLALSVTFIIQPGTYSEFTVLQLLMNISGLQILFPDPIVWFVSAILLFYFLFPFFIFFAKKIARPYTVSIFLVTLVIFIVLVVARIALISIDDRVFIYYWFFVVGIVLGKGTSISSIKASARINVLLFLGIGLLIGYLYIRSMTTAFPEPMEQLTSSVSRLAAMFVIGVIGVLLAIQFTNSFKRYFTGCAYHLIERIAPSTYSIYLFHSYFLSIAALLATELSPVLVLFSVIIIGIPLAILIPPYIQDAVGYAVSLMVGEPKSRA